MPEAERTKFKEHMDLIMNGAQSVEIDAYTLRKDGTRLETMWSLSWSEQLGLMVAVIHDLTVRKQAKQLKADFTAMVVHDVRSPLSTVRMFLVVRTQEYRQLGQAIYPSHV